MTMMVIEAIPKVSGMVYAVVATIAVVVLFRTDRFNMKTGYLLLALSTVFGFLVFAPMLPYQFQAFLLGNTAGLGVPVAMAAAVLLLFIVLAFLFGRAFCGYVCPIGAAQELAYHVPVRKLKLRGKVVPVTFRLVFLIAAVALALASSIGLLTYLGIRDFFYLNVTSAFFYVFLALVIVGVFFYRPFCRFLCPYGALLGLASVKGVFKLRRNENCIECGECEEVCPTGEAGRTDRKQECYMCNRCREVCPADAIAYVRRRVRRPLAGEEAHEPELGAVGAGREEDD